MLKPFLPLMVPNTDNLLQLNNFIDLSLTYKIFSIRLIVKSSIVAILHSWPQNCTLGQKHKNLGFPWREKK